MEVMYEEIKVVEYNSMKFETTQLKFDINR
jgi:hypothetical protein